MKARHALGGAQRILHQHAAAWAELDEVERRLAERVPFVCAPEPDQFAEHLAGFRRGEEIGAVPTDRGPRRLIAGLRIVQARGHVLRDTHRPVLLDVLDESLFETHPLRLGLSLRLARVRRRR